MNTPQEKQDIFAKKITKVLDNGLNLDASIQSRLEFARKQTLAKIAMPETVINGPSDRPNKIKVWAKKWFSPRGFAAASAFAMMLGIIQIAGEETEPNNDLNYIYQYVSTADSFDIQ